jgi:hypothetical protein
MGTALGPLSDLSNQVSSGATSGLGSLLNSIPSGLSSGLALLFLLPVLGMFLRPILRLGGTFAYSLSALASAVIVCISSSMILVIQYVTALAQALKPRPINRNTLKVMLIAGLILGVFSLARYSLSHADRSLNQCLVHGKIDQQCVSKLGAERF